MRMRLIKLSLPLVLAGVSLLVLYPVLPHGPVDVPLVSAASDETPIPLVDKGGGSGRIVAEVPPRLRNFKASDLQIRIATFLRPSTADVVVELIDRVGRVTARCRFPRLSYRDAVAVTCARRGGGSVSQIRVSAHGAKGQVAIFGDKTSSGYRIGRWYERASGDSLWKRVDFAVGAVSSLRPSPFRFPLLVFALVLAGGLLGFLVRQILASPEAG